MAWEAVTCLVQVFSSTPTTLSKQLASFTSPLLTPQGWRKEQTLPFQAIQTCKMTFQLETTLFARRRLPTKFCSISIRSTQSICLSISTMENLPFLTVGVSSITTVTTRQRILASIRILARWYATRDRKIRICNPWQLAILSNFSWAILAILLTGPMELPKSYPNNATDSPTHL